MLVNTSRQKRLASDREILIREFPNCFARLQSNSKLPLKVGIVHDLLAIDIRDEAGEQISRVRIREAVNDYCYGPKYQLALLRNVNRIDLYGNNAGQVTEVDRCYAENEIRRFSAKWHEKAKIGRIRESDCRTGASGTVSLKVA